MIHLTDLPQDFTIELTMYTLNDYCREIFGEKLYKISLNGGFTCPNRDGTLGSRGCIFPAVRAVPGILRKILMPLLRHRSQAGKKKVEKKMK